MTKEEIEVLSVDLDEYYVDKIVSQKKCKNPKNWKFKVRLVGYEPEDDSWLNWTSVKDLAALDTYSREHTELFRLKSVSWLRDDQDFCRRIVLQIIGNSGYIVAKPGFWSLNCVLNLVRVL